MPEVYVHAIEGRSKEQKRALIKDITDAVVKNFGVTADAVLVEILRARATTRRRAACCSASAEQRQQSLQQLRRCRRTTADHQVDRHHLRPRHRCRPGCRRTRRSQRRSRRLRRPISDPAWRASCVPALPACSCHRPVTNRTSAWRGEATKRKPKRSRS